MKRVLLFFVIVLLPACVTVAQKQCPKPDVHVVQSPGGPLFVLDTAGITALSERMSGLRAGTCAPDDE